MTMTPAEAKKELNELVQRADGYLNQTKTYTTDVHVLYILASLVQAIEILADQLPQGEEHEK